MSNEELEQKLNDLSAEVARLYEAQNSTIVTLADVISILIEHTGARATVEERLNSTPAE